MFETLALISADRHHAKCIGALHWHRQSLCGAGLDRCRHADRDRVCRHVAQNNSISADDHIVADCDRPQQFCTRSDIDIIPDRWSQFFFDPAQADRDAISNPAIVTERCVPAHNNAAKMIDHKITADRGLARKFDAGDDLDKLEKNFINEREKLPNDDRSHTIPPPAKPIHQHDPKSLRAPIAIICAKVASDILQHLTPAPIGKCQVIGQGHHLSRRLRSPSCRPQKRQHDCEFFSGPAPLFCRPHGVLEARQQRAARCQSDRCHQTPQAIVLSKVQ